MTADDVIYSLQRIATKSNGLTGYAATATMDVPGVRKLDKYTVRIPLKTPDATVPQTLASYTFGIVPVGYQAYPHPQIGTGAYKLKSFTPGQQSVSVRNPNYWRSGVLRGLRGHPGAAGDPARAILGRSATPASLAALEPVSTLLAPKLVNSGVLVVISPVVSIPLSIAIGSWAALKREKIFDTLSSNLLLVLAALPEFVVAVVLVTLFATTVFNVLPAISQIPPGSRLWNNPSGLVLPALTLAIAVAP
jgi:hypothetical protein